MSYYPQYNLLKDWDFFIFASPERKRSVYSGKVFCLFVCLILFVIVFQVLVDSTIHGDPVHSRRSFDASCHVFCYIGSGKEVCVPAVN